MTEIKNIKPTQRDVKNEDRPDYVYENKGEDDIMSCYRDDFLAEHSQIARVGYSLDSGTTRCSMSGEWKITRRN
jgi:hypothetical protein